MTEIRPRASVLVTNGDKFVLIFRHKNGQDYYAIPGGGIEEGETPEQAAVREIQEELGLDIYNLENISRIKTKMRDDYNFIVNTNDQEFNVTGPEKNRLNDSNNLFRPEWLNYQTYKKNIPIFPESAREMFEQYMRKIAPEINL